MVGYILAISSDSDIKTIEKNQLSKTTYVCNLHIV